MKYQFNGTNPRVPTKNMFGRALSMSKTAIALAPLEKELLGWS